jgi:hypothetical protein
LTSTAFDVVVILFIHCFVQREQKPLGTSDVRYMNDIDGIPVGHAVGSNMSIDQQVVVTTKAFKP